MINHLNPTIVKPVLAVRSLSVGNFLKRNGIVVTIDARSIFDIWNDESLVKIEYEPILITMEWFKGFGFVFEDIDKDSTVEELSYRKAIKGYGSKAFEIEFNRLVDAFTLENITGELIMYKYVHELQNLYYWLVGTELLLNDR